MKFFTRYSVLFISFYVLAGQTSAGDVVRDFWKCLNGNYTNSKEVSEDVPSKPKHDQTQALCIPVRLPALPGPVIYFKETLNKVVVRQTLWSLRSDKENIVNASIYSFNYASSSGDFNLDAVLAALKPEDLHTDQDCFAVYIQLPNGAFAGDMADCEDNVNGKHPRYDGIIDCNSIIAKSPPAAKETTTFIPYVVLRSGERYPLPDESAA